MRSSISRRNVIALGVRLVFIVGFIPYMTKVTDSMLLIAPIALICMAFIITPLVMPRQTALILKSLRRSRALFLILVLPAAPTLVALLNGHFLSVSYAILMSVVLASMQVMLVMLSFGGLVDALATAALTCVPAFVFTSLPSLLEALRSGHRFIPDAAQPNAIGFIFVGFAIACAWKVFRKETRISLRVIYLSIMIMASSVIFLASSRASMLALAFAMLIPFCIHALKTFAKGRVPKYVVTILFVIIAGSFAIFLALSSETLTKLGSYVMHVLAINSSDRGLNSGLSGRIVRWDKAMQAISSNLRWLVGSGYRTADPELGFFVDNGYLTLWYESGLLGFIFIVGQMAWVAFKCASAIKCEKIHDNMLKYVLLGFTIALLINNIFDRYLFGLGNPFSLFALGILLINWDDLTQIVTSSRSATVANTRTGVVIGGKK